MTRHLVSGLLLGAMLAFGGPAGGQRTRGRSGSVQRSPSQENIPRMVPSPATATTWPSSASTTRAVSPSRAGPTCSKSSIATTSRRPRAARQLVERLIRQDGVKYLLGPYSSGLTEAIAPVTEKYGVPMVEANGAAISLFRKGYRYLFAVLSTTDQYLRGAVELAAAVNEDPRSSALRWPSRTIPSRRMCARASWRTQPNTA